MKNPYHYLIISAPKRWGKTTMLNHARGQGYHVADTGEQLKKLWVATRTRAAFRSGQAYIKGEPIAMPASYLDYYEELKEDKRRLGQEDDFRLEVVGFAETLRAVDPAIFVKMAYSRTNDGLTLSTTINQEEADLVYDRVGRHNCFVAQADEPYPAGDSRERLTEYDLLIQYGLFDSLKVVEDLIALVKGEKPHSDYDVLRLRSES
jgi:hypothetical protein